MRPWRPKRKQPPSETAAGEPGGGPAPLKGDQFPVLRRSTGHQPKRIRIYMTQLAALPVIGLVGLLGASFLLVGPNGVAGLGEPEPIPVQHLPGKQVVVEGWEHAEPGSDLPLPPDPAALRDVLGDPKVPPLGRRRAAQALGSLSGQEALGELLEASYSGDQAVRRLSAVGLVRRLDDFQARDAIDRLIEDPVLPVAASVASELATVKGGREILVHRLSGQDPPSMVHVACMEGLADVGTPEDLPLLLRYTRGTGEALESAVYAVRKICKRFHLDPPRDLPDPFAHGE